MRHPCEGTIAYTKSSKWFGTLLCPIPIPQPPEQPGYKTSAPETSTLASPPHQAPAGSVVPTLTHLRKKHIHLRPGSQLCFRRRTISCLQKQVIKNRPHRWKQPILDYLNPATASVGASCPWLWQESLSRSPSGKVADTS